MCSYVLMRILESAPSRYDKGIRILTFGKLDKAYDRLTSYIKKEQKVLDVGCGTGLLTIRAALKGARVKGIDINPQMLEIARKRVVKAGVTDYVKLCEMGVAELGAEDPESYDIVMSGLCFSELTEDEFKYTLKEIMRILRPRGVLLVADESIPKNPLKRFINILIRTPLTLFTYLVTQTTTNAIKDLKERILEEGFIIESIKLNWLENFIELVAKKPVEKIGESN